MAAGDDRGVGARGEGEGARGQAEGANGQDANGRAQDANVQPDGANGRAQDANRQPDGAPAGPAPLVVKVGGSCLADLAPAWWDGLAAEIVQAAPAAMADQAAPAAPAAKLIVVHGWSKLVSARTPAGQPDFLVDKHGFRSRYTTTAVLEEIERVASELRERIAALLRERGLRAGAVSGADERLLRAEVRPNMWWVGDDLVELTNLVGPVRAVDGGRLAALLDDVDALVVSPLAVADGHPRVNTDADRAAAALATAAGAERLALVMEAPAVLADGRPVARATRADLGALAGHATGGMGKKLRAVDAALAGGVRTVGVGNAPPGDLLAGRAGTLFSTAPDPGPASDPDRSPGSGPGSDPDRSPGSGPGPKVSI